MTPDKIFGRLEEAFTMVYPKVSELAAWSDNCKWYRCNCIAILGVSLVSFAAIVLCVASKRVFIIALVVISLATQCGAR
jgi:hypothetical protein